MKRKDFYFYLWAFPFIGGFLGFILSILLQPGQSGIGSTIILGVIAGFMAVICLVIGEKYCDSDSSSNDSKK